MDEPWMVKHAILIGATMGVVSVLGGCSGESPADRGLPAPSVPSSTSVSSIPGSTSAGSDSPATIDASTTLPLGAPGGLGPDGEAAAPEQPLCKLLTVEEVSAELGGDYRMVARAPVPGGVCQFLGDTVLNVLPVDDIDEFESEKAARVKRDQARVVTGIGDDAFEVKDTGATRKLWVRSGQTAFWFQSSAEMSSMEALAKLAAERARTL